VAAFGDKEALGFDDILEDTLQQELER